MIVSIVNKELHFRISYDMHCLPEKAAVQTRINFMSNYLSNVPYYDNW